MNLIPTLLTQAQSDKLGPAFTPGEGVTPKTFWMPEGASTLAPEIDWVFDFINYINYFFFALVVGLMLYFVWKYRQKGREVYARGPSHNTVLELGWTILPTLIVVVIFFMGFRGFVSAKTIPANSYQIDVTALRYGWVFKYPNGATSEDLYVPAGKPVKLVMRSNDVLHSLYIRDFRVKQDVVPGRYTTMWFQADNPTEGEDFHWLFCTEYCGVGHSNMNRKVFVLPESDFDSWVVEQGRWLDKIPEDELYFKAGPKLYARCASCHTLDGKPGSGPSWGNYDGTGNIWARSQPGSQHKVDNGKPLSDFIGDGKQYASAEAYIRASILNPGEHVVDGFGNVMPTFRGQLSDKAIDALIGMMRHLDEFDAKGNWTKKTDGAAEAPAAK
ncbi:MAG: cytochrome c oxidase subunit II [Planctomycetota bacterium]